MKEFLIVSLLVCAVVGEAPAPYPASGWRPNGPAFELPSRTQTPQQVYLPAGDPRRPATPDIDPEADVSVQGLPVVEQQPIFELSPINGQQTSGLNFQSDLRKLNERYQQQQYQQQLAKAREFERQRQFEAARANANRFPSQQVPRQFGPSTATPTTTTETPVTTTESDLNEGETEDKPEQKVSVEVSKQNLQEYPPELFLSPLAQLKFQPQFLPLQQFGQLQAPVFYQPAQKEKQVGFDGPAHLSALPSVLAQNQLAKQLQGQQFQNPAFVVSGQQEQAPPRFLIQAQESINQYQPAVNTQYQPLVQPVQTQAFPQFQAQPVILPPQAKNQVQPTAEYTPDADEVENIDQNQPQYAYQPQTSYQPQIFQNVQPQPIQPVVQPQLYQPQAVQPQVYQPQSVQPQVYQPQAVQPQDYQPQAVQPQSFQPQAYQPDAVQPQVYQPDNTQPQVYQQTFPQVYQPQAFSQQPQQSQFQSQQPQFQPQQARFQPQQSQFQPQAQPQLIYNPDLAQYYQGQFVDPNQLQAQVQGQDALQSGLDINQQGNGIDKEENDAVEGTTATAVATAFGARTQPRVFSQYGAPVPTAGAFQTTTDSGIRDDESVTEDGPAIAQATAVATGRRKSAKLRSRRVRPVFTLDRSGHLVLAQEQ